MSESPLSQFVQVWTHPDYPPEPVRRIDLEIVEEHFEFRLPESYKEAVLSIGLPQPTIGLLNAIVERELELADVSAFLHPADMVKRTEGWQELGMPANLVAFATDCSGNLFAFERQRRGSSAIWLFDHDSRQVSEVARDFEDWIERFCRIEPVVD